MLYVENYASRNVKRVPGWDTTMNKVLYGPRPVF